jgi:vacuolar-type H+-ATPase subunit E/Vma4
MQAIKTVPTPEQLEYGELAKKMRVITAKLRVAQEGIDIASVSQQNMDKLMRIFDDTEYIQRDVQQKTSKIQQDANFQIKKINQDADKKFGDIQKKYQEIIKSIKEGYPIKEEQVQETVVQPIVEDVIDKTREEKVSEITDNILKSMRDSVYKRVDEIMNVTYTKTETMVGRGIDSQDVIEEPSDHTKQTTVESAIIGSDEEKNIPIISQENTKKIEND